MAIENIRTKNRKKRRLLLLFLEQHVVRAAFDDAGGRHKCDFGVLLEVLEANDTTGAHRRLDFVDCDLEVVLELAGVWYV